MNSKISIETAINNLEKSTMFQMSLGSKELFHSNFLKWIFSIDPELFKKIVNKLLGSEMEFHEDFTVKREYENYDLCVVHEEDRVRKAKNPKITVIDLVIENKVKSIPNKEQLEKYLGKTKEARHLLLTLVSEFDGVEYVSKDWDVATYVDLANAIEESAETSKVSGYHREIIKDYVSFIRNLNLVANECSIGKLVSYFNPYSGKLIELRINDLIEKLRACEIAMRLKQRINKSHSFGRDNMFQYCGVGNVVINYGLTHAQGLFELKVLVEKKKEEEVALVIQVQGDKYCHAIELNKTKKEHIDNWSHVFSESSPYRWFLFPDQKFESRDEKGYNKYGDEFLYRYMPIDRAETIENIVNRVCSDYEDICDHFPQISRNVSD